MIPSFVPIAACSAAGLQGLNWALNLRVLPLPPGKYAGDEKHRWRNAVVALVNSILGSCLTIICLFHPGLWNDPMMFYTEWMDICFAFLCGYYVYDLSDLLLHNRLAKIWSLVAHHVIMFGASVILSLEQQAMGVNTIGLSGEISAIFLHSRQLLLMYGFSKSSLTFRLHKMANLVTFVPTRLVPLSYAAYCSYTTSGLAAHLAASLPFCTTSILAINVILFRRLVISDFRARDNKDNHVMDN